MPKILLGVSSSFCANFLKGQIAFLVQQGFDVIIISGPGEEISMLAKKENARLYPVNFTKKITPFTDFFQLLRIIQIIRKEKPDIINAGNPKSGFLIMIASWITGHKKRIFTLHGLLSDTKKGITRSLISISEKISCNIAAQVLVVSHSLKIHAENRKILSPKKGIVIGRGSANGIDLSLYSRNEANEMHARLIKKQFGFKGDEMVLGYIGRITKDKGISVLVHAFNILRTKYPFLRLVLAGPTIEENPLSEQLLHQLNHDESIFYMGKLFDVTPVYHVINILVLPSMREGLPNVLIEAAAMEVPVVASDIPGCRDAVLPDINGELFEKNNVDSLMAILEKLINNTALREQYGMNGRKFVQDNFTNETIWKGQLNIYQKLLGNS